nr:unnamed protein product [Callosobruchus analis]
MVRNYKRKTERGNWSEQSMKNAVNAVVKREMGYKLAAKTYSVPQTTLERKVKAARVALEDPATSATSRIGIYSGSKKWEATLLNSEKQEPGKDWVQGFLSRHPELSIRKPESTSAARAAGFNKQAVDHFFNFLGKVYDEHKLSPDRIYNCDETGVSVVPKTKSKSLQEKVGNKWDL